MMGWGKLKKELREALAHLHFSPGPAEAENKYQVIELCREIVKEADNDPTLR